MGEAEPRSRWGLLILDKPPGITSHTAVRRAQRALGASRVGHAGTLDPLASGVLLVGIGRATRLLEYLVGHDKVYRAVIRLGEVRDTLDREGRVLETRAVPSLSTPDIQEALGRFLGTIEQVPPAHSAIKVGGVALHRRARRGQVVEPPPRNVTIRRLELLGRDGDDLTVEIECGSGTYVRSLARDLGEALATGGTLWQLIRLRSGPFALEHAVGLADLESEGAAAWSRVLPPIEMVRDLPAIELSEPETARLHAGRAIERSEAAEGRDLAAFAPEGTLVAIVRAEGGVLRPSKVFLSDP
ncbi:MAG: tRNA pseudouridine(55) synthase TruB [Deltaproteobacteria bacterium]|nr:tRNA pseudouridine(55) synthase TruB [Deltaproteobacteria bacterium]